MTFAEKLKELRGAAALSREELSGASGLSRGVIRDYEQGKRKPTLESAFKLARALGISVEAFAECVAEDGGKRGNPARQAEKLSKAKRPRGRPRKSEI